MVAVGLKDGTLPNKFVTQLGGINQVAVVTEGDLPVRTINQDRLSIDDAAVAECGIAHVSDCGPSDQRAEHALVENVADVAHRAGLLDATIAGHRDPRALLSSVLERVETKVGHVRGIWMSEDAEYPAFVLELVDRVGRVVVGCRRVERIHAARPPKYRLSPGRPRLFELHEGLVEHDLAIDGHPKLCPTGSANQTRWDTFLTSASEQLICVLLGDGHDDTRSRLPE